MADVRALLDVLGLDGVHIAGTSLGGLVALATDTPGRIRSPVLNDIGPDIDPRGAARVAAYAATVPARFTDLAAATDRAVAQYPWLQQLPASALAEAIRWAVRPAPDGGRRFKFDPGIGEAPWPTVDAARAAALSRWASLDALRCPILLIRGAEIDILSAETAAAMERRQPRLRRVDVEGVGHAPALVERAVVAALDAFYVGNRAATASSWPQGATDDDRERDERRGMR